MIPGFTGISLFASNLVSDSSHVVVRQPAEEFIDSYKSQKEFAYWMQPPVETNLFKQLIEYLKKRFKSWERFSDYIPLIFKILMGLLFVFFLFMIVLHRGHCSG